MADKSVLEQESDMLTSTDILALETYLRGVQQAEGPKVALLHYHQLRHDVRVRYWYSIVHERLELRTR